MGVSDKIDGVAKEMFRKDAGSSRFGRIDARVLEQKPGEVPNAPYEVIAEGDDLSANLARMQLFVHGLNVAGFAYRGDRQNSNSFAAAANRMSKVDSSPAKFGVVGLDHRGKDDDAGATGLIGRSSMNLPSTPPVPTG
jgi:hypothetical protein